MYKDISDLIAAIKQEKVKSARTVEDSVWNQCIDYIMAGYLQPYNKSLNAELPTTENGENTKLSA